MYTHPNKGSQIHRHMNTHTHTHTTISLKSTSMLHMIIIASFIFNLTEKKTNYWSVLEVSRVTANCMNWSSMCVLFLLEELFDNKQKYEFSWMF